MNVSINFPDELGNALRLTAAAAGTDIETFVKQIVAERLAERDLLSESDCMSPQVFAERQAAWVKLHPVLDMQSTMVEGSSTQVAIDACRARVALTIDHRPLSPQTKRAPLANKRGLGVSWVGVATY